MKTLEEVFEILEENDFQIERYTENDKVCGYDLNTYTEGGVNEVLFLDFRNENKSALNVQDFIVEFEEIFDNWDIDEKIDMYREDERYKNDFTIQESLKDFKKYKKKLKAILKLIRK